MKKLSLLVVALLALGAGGALAQDVSYNFAKDAKFSDYKTYKWVDVKGADEPNQITQNHDGNDIVPGPSGNSHS